MARITRSTGNRSRRYQPTRRSRYEEYQRELERWRDRLRSYEDEAQADDD